jgi:hypothetical protein
MVPLLSGPKRVKYQAPAGIYEEAAVQPTQFDSFGERLPEYEAQTRGPQSAVSRWMLRGGIGLFWSLVAVVLAARVIYFDPDLAAKFGQFAASLSAIFGA